MIGRRQKLGRLIARQGWVVFDRRARERCDGRSQRGGEVGARQLDDRDSAGWQGTGGLGL